MKYYQAEELFTNIKRSIYCTDQTIENNGGKKKAFDNLSTDDKLKFIAPQLEIYRAAVQSKSQILPTIATLAATLVVVATLNNDLVPLTANETKIILSIFLLFIPTTLHYYIKQAEHTAINALSIIQSYHGDDIFEKFFKPTFFAQLSSDFPMIIVYIFYGIVFWILFRIFGI